MTIRLPRIVLVTLTATLVWPALALAWPAVLVNPHARGHATAKTIQEGIDMVDPGGKVMVLPGTYDEAIVIDKGLILEGVGAASGPVIIKPPVAAPGMPPTVAVQVATSEPVAIRDVTVQFTGVSGIRGDGVVDVAVERVRVLADNPPLDSSFLVGVSNNAPTTGRARLTVSESFLDGTVPPPSSEPPPPFPQVLGIRVQGDVDARLEGNVIRRTGGACIVVFMRNDFAGETNADIFDNDLDECYPRARLGSLIVQAQLVPPAPATATGVVNIIGNTIRNTFGSCLPTTAIVQSFGTGRIERNRVLGVVQPCAITLPTRTPGAIWIGSLLAGAPPTSSVVRFNDIEGNAHAGLRVGPNITTPLDARCNWWGSASGPSGAGPGTGDALGLEPGAATPDFAPWALMPIAEMEEPHAWPGRSGRRADDFHHHRFTGHYCR
jgi:hypothetical protein